MNEEYPEGTGLGSLGEAEHGILRDPDKRVIFCFHGVAISESEQERPRTPVVGRLECSGREDCSTYCLACSKNLSGSSSTFRRNFLFSVSSIAMNSVRLHAFVPII